MIVRLLALFLLSLGPLWGDAYKLTLQAQSPGLFCVFNTVLGALDAYDKGSFQGLVVDFKDKGLYYDSEVGLNWWNYYFEPIHLGVEEGQQLKLFPQYRKTIFSLTGAYDMSLERAHALIQKYIRIKPALAEKIDELFERDFKGNYVIGVHYRGTDKKSEASVVEYEEFKRNVDEVSGGKECKIFVATDDAKFFQFMKAKYPQQVFGLDAIRSSNGKPVHFTGRENFRKGEEAVIDALLLSKCQYLIRNSSNLSYCSREFNPTIPTRELNVSTYEETNNTSELFSNFNTVLALLDQYDKGETSSLEVANDMWEYFEPLKLGDGTSSPCLPNYRKRILSLTSQFEMGAERCSALYTKYIKIKPEIEEKANRFLPKVPLLGVYYHKSNEKDLQPPLSYEEVLTVIRKQLEKMPANTQIFLVTPDRGFEGFLKDRFPALTYNKGSKGEKELLQALLLSKTDALIRTSNTFSKSVSQLNPHLLAIDLDKNWQEVE